MSAAFWEPDAPVEQNPETTEFAVAEKRAVSDIIIGRYDATPRHRQKALGPSQIAHACHLRIVLHLLGIVGTNPSFDPWASIVGTAVHTWLESAASYANLVLGRIRWHSEIRVNPASWLSGTCDLYDADTRTVIDYKIPGAARLKQYRKKMSSVYRAQVHLYGKGFENAGLAVENVAVMMIGRNSTLESAYFWTEEYDPSIADEALNRRERAVSMIRDYDLKSHPERLSWIAKSGPDCLYCPFWSPSPSTPFECAGVDD